MRTIPLTQGYEALVDDEDYEFLRQWTWHVHRGKRDKTIYARRSFYVGKVNGRHKYGSGVFMHNAVAERAGLDLNKTIDHKDRDGLNNRRRNLRTASSSQQIKNRGVLRNSKSGIKGVRLLPSGSWAVRISIDGKGKHLGCFPSKELAAEAYAAAASMYYGEFAAQ